MAFRVPRSRAFQTHATLRDEITQALEPLLYTTMQDGYRIRAEFEQAFARAVGQPHAVAVHSGTLALFLALRAGGVGPGDEVITVGNSDISTTAAIRHCGATPVLVDVLPTDYTIDPSRVEAHITRRTRALLPVDLHGHPADVRALRAIADAYGLIIVEDAALAAGAMDHGRPVGAFADAAIFSFAPYKPLGSAGNGAAVVTPDPAMAERLRQLVGYGYGSGGDLPAGHQHYVAEGYNAPLDTLQAALLLVKLPHLDAWTRRRREIAAAYQAGLADTAARLPSFRVESVPTFRSYTICVPDQAAMYAALRQQGVEVVLHYTPPVYRHPVYHDIFPTGDHLPVTDQLARELICLPVSPELTEADIQFAISTIRKLLAR